MEINKLVEMLNDSRCFTEFEFKTDDEESYIIGHVSEIKNPAGWGRREFVIRDKVEQITFLEAYTELLKLQLV